jgi:acetyltransferase-like isoleucine patch superfamily enzyme
MFSYGTPLVFQQPGRKLRIGNFCSIAQEVTIHLGGNHRMDRVTTYPFVGFPDNWPEAEFLPVEEVYGVSKGDVVIGNDVWIGYGATILSGVRIGDGAVIGARALVARDVEPYAIVAGNPARLVRKRFDEDTIRQLLEIRWWDWPIDKIKANMTTILGTDIAKLLAVE